jgi:hypothetical protein
MADKGTVGAGARTGWAASNGANQTPAVPTGFTQQRYRLVGKTSNDGYPQPVNPILHRRTQTHTADPLLTSD